MKAWITNPWGKPRFLVLFTWLFVVWSIFLVLAAISTFRPKPAASVPAYAPQSISAAAFAGLS